jgi:predicted GH43/DUF377 family glycosyl hydrolase
MSRTFCLLFIAALYCVPVLAQTQMMFSDTSRGRPFAKDPHVVQFKGRYLMYYSVGPYLDGRAVDPWSIGIAESRDLINWQKVGEILPQTDYEAQGMCAPGAVVVNGKIHLFYQTYGNGPKDAICHAVSEDGLRFTRDASNPVFHPTGAWTSGRAIDAEVIIDGPTAFLYFATRDPASKIQKLGVATASAKSDFGRAAWKQASDDSILFPQLSWEQECIEAASVIKRGQEFVMFYAGGVQQFAPTSWRRDQPRWHPLATDVRPAIHGQRQAGRMERQRIRPPAHLPRPQRAYLSFLSRQQRQRQELVPLTTRNRLGERQAQVEVNFPQ